MDGDPTQSSEFKVCSKANCDKKANCKGLCRYHYGAERKGVCGDCGRERELVTGEGVCSLCHRKALKGLAPLQSIVTPADQAPLSAMVAESGQVCSVSNCVAPVLAKGQCAKHYNLQSRERRRGPCTKCGNRRILIVRKGNICPSCAKKAPPVRELARPRKIAISHYLKTEAKKEPKEIASGFRINIRTFYKWEEAFANPKPKQKPKGKPSMASLQLKKDIRDWIVDLDGRTYIDAARYAVTDLGLEHCSRETVRRWMRELAKTEAAGVVV